MSTETLLKQTASHDELKDSNFQTVCSKPHERKLLFPYFDFDFPVICEYPVCPDSSAPSLVPPLASLPQNLAPGRSNSLSELRRKPLPVYSSSPENEKAILQKLVPGMHSKSKDGVGEELNAPIIGEAEQTRMPKHGKSRRGHLAAKKFKANRLSTIQELIPPLPSPEAPKRAPPLIPAPPPPEFSDREQVLEPDSEFDNSDTASKSDIHLLGLSYERRRPISTLEEQALESLSPPPIPQWHRPSGAVATPTAPGLVANISLPVLAILETNSAVAGISSPSEQLIDMDVHKYRVPTKLPLHSRPTVPYTRSERDPPTARYRNHHYEGRGGHRGFTRQPEATNLDGYIALNREEAQWYLLICRHILHEDVNESGYRFTGQPDRSRDRPEFRGMDGGVVGGGGSIALRGRRKRSRGGGSRVARGMVDGRGAAWGVNMRGYI